MSIKRALLVGINYFKNPSAQLNGCIEDINNIRGVLMDAYGYNSENIIMLRDDDPSKMPTKAKIMVALQSIVASSGVNDEVWIHYSGHGTQLRDTNGDESDRLDEAIVPVDYQTVGMISDDELFNVVRNLRCRAFLVFDSCHSGSVGDLQYSIHYVNGAFSKAITSNKSVGNPNVVMMSGCRDAQTSADSFDHTVKEFGGALTISLIESLRKNKHTADILKIYNDTCYLLMRTGYSQIPVLSSSVANPTLRFTRDGMVSIQPLVVKQNGVVMSVAAASAMKKSVGKRTIGNTSMNMFFVK
jgi:hypothetical protein